jgi:hypothetical protein
MKISLQELKYHKLYDNLPEKLKELKTGEYYCFYYVPDYDNSKIVIVKDFVSLNLNTSLYRDVYNVVNKAKSSDIFLGYFTNKIETRDGLVYLMLNSLFDKEVVIDFFAYANENDTKNDIKISNSASVEVYNRDSFSDAMAYFVHPDKLNTVLSIYDIVDDFVKRNHNTTLYGGIVKRVVQMVTHESGVMADENGTLRYMTIGEKAVLTESQKDKLKTAKSLIRSLINPNDVYVQTGWYYNVNDGLWRTNISDFDSSINETFLVKVSDTKIYNPPYSPVTQEQILNSLKKPEYLLSLGYNGKLNDVLNHKVLFSHYPQLATLPLFFAYNNANIFYFSGSGEESGFINIQGQKEKHHILSILLHETQHAIQSIEGFAKGGNQHFADFVIALGGKGVRRIFASISNFQKFIYTQINTEYLYNELKSAIEQIKANSNNARYLKSTILSDYMQNYDIFRSNTNNIGFYLIYLISDTKVFNEGAIIDFLESNYGDEIYEMFELIKEGIESSNRASEKLLSEGYNKEDVRIINFNTYQNLLGEMEARGTQHQMRIPVNLSNYFFLNEWEKSPTKSVAVIGGRYVFRDTSKIVGACEKCLDGKYILHFKKNISSIPFIHELGHIVHDMVIERGFGNVVKNEYDKEIVADDYEEYFVNVFLGYIAENYSDSLLGSDFAKDFSIKKNEVIFHILSDIFSPKPKDLNEVQSYIKNLEELTGN